MKRLGVIILVAVLASATTTVVLWMLLTSAAPAVPKGGNQAPSGEVTSPVDPSPVADENVGTTTPPQTNQPPSETIHTLLPSDWVPLSGVELTQVPVGFEITEDEKRGLHFVKEQLPEADQKFTQFMQNKFWITNKNALYGNFQVSLRMIVPSSTTGGRIDSIGVRAVDGSWEVSFQGPGRAGFDTEHTFDLVRQGDVVHLTHDDRMISGRIFNRKSRPQKPTQLEDACHFFIKINGHDEFWITKLDLTRPAGLKKGVKRFNDFIPEGAVLPSDIAERPKRTGEQVVQLPGEIEEICWGENGRSLIAYVPTTRKLFVIDIDQRKQRGEILVESEVVRFAAGKDKLFISPNPYTLERWDLASLTKEAEVSLAADEQVLEVSMGSAADGPLLVVKQSGEQEAEPALWNAQTLQPLDMPITYESKRSRGSPLPWGRKPQIRAAANGQVFGVTGPQESFQLLCEPSRATLTLERSSSDRIQLIIPDPFGRRQFGMRSSTYTPNFRSGTPGIPIPAMQGNLCLKAALLRSDDAAPLDLCPAYVKFFVDGDEDPFTSLKDLDLTLPKESFMNKWRETRLADDQRIQWIPDLDTIVTLPHSGGRIVFRAFDMEQIWEKTDYNYLYVVDPTPIVTVRGTTLEYQLEFRSKVEPITIRRVNPSAFRGLKISDSGLIQWEVPTEFKASTDQLTILLKAGEREVEFPMTIRVVDPAPETPPAANADPTPWSSKSEEPKPPAMRTWTDRETGRTIQASLVSVSEGTIRIVRADGQPFDLALDRLSDEDKAYVSSRRDQLKQDTDR